tara:strand:+ start:69 stop:314 length:246 start_codon:yes stop_codon:yes gene_type:complete
MSWIPKVMHISYGYEGALCGAKSRTWPDKYMADVIARTLPLCVKCIEVKGIKSVGTGVKVSVAQKVETQVMRLYLKDYLTI